MAIRSEPKPVRSLPHSPRDRQGAVTGAGSGFPKRIVVLLLFLLVASAGVLALAGGEDQRDSRGGVVQGPSTQERYGPAERGGSLGRSGVSGGDSNGDVGNGNGSRGATEPESDETRRAGRTTELNRSETERILHRLINEKRRSRGLEPLRRHETLSEVALEHSTNMSESGYVGHTDPSGEGVKRRYSQACGKEPVRTRSSWSENVAKVWFGKEIFFPKQNRSVLLESEEEVARFLAKGWMESEDHREAILSKKWRSTGVGVVSNETGAVFATQAFCTEG